MNFCRRYRKAPLFGNESSLKGRGLLQSRVRFMLVRGTCFRRLSVDTIPILIVRVWLSKVLNACSSLLRTPMVIGAVCLVMAAPSAPAEWLATLRRGTNNLTLRDGLLIGIAQVGALILRVSQSVSTFTASPGLGFACADAARVSFLLGVPAVAATRVL